MKAVHFGAGNIGRGFVAEFLFNSGYEIVFCDVTDSLVDQLNKKKSYKVIQVGPEVSQEISIKNYRAINNKTDEDAAVEEIKNADLVTCSVGPAILKFIAPVIAKGIDQRANDKLPVAVIACENAIGATDILAEHIKDFKNTNPERLVDLYERARFANSAVDRIVPAQDVNAGLDVKLEQFYEWIIDRTPFEEDHIPSIKGVEWVDNLMPYIERKLFTVNTGHAAAAYYGYFYKKKTVWDALQDDKIREEVEKVLAETSNLITSKHFFSEEEQQKYAAKIIKRISNPYLEDTVERVGRAPIRKLSRKERFVGPAVELAEQGRSFDALLNAIEMAFLFNDVQEDFESLELGRILASRSPEKVVEEICGLNQNDPLFPHIVQVVIRVQGIKSKN
ncbi:Mannitol-1-phosphate 5-dehydrogenase [Golovinomyces cichoracearum]|uniref:Mannitol-1-phosphate 5-dehydrogenase n=1 Tax=Golovinomyces cichoracearum TaxID=62708 RepID=A0A420IRT7_9PEZI|nr:Mannitol-1-phosphate 5-dehydrogenase [Golovinomyces cichoracearum]